MGPLTFGERGVHVSAFQKDSVLVLCSLTKIGHVIHFYTYLAQRALNNVRPMSHCYNCAGLPDQ